MSNTSLEFLGNVLLFLLVVPLGGLWLMNKVSKHDFVTKQWRAAADDGKELNLRSGGYTVEEVTRHWSVLDQRARQLQVLFLQVDLLYPLLYGVAFAVTAEKVWTRLGQPSLAVWSLIPIVLIMAADWTENLLQLNQLRGFMEYGAAGLQTEKIRIASRATRIKLYLFWVTGIVLLVLAVFAALFIP